MLLTATNESIELLTDVAGSIDYFAEFTDRLAGALSSDGSNGNINTATTTAIVAAPAASTERVVRRCSFYNRSTTADNTLTVKLDVGGTERHQARAVLGPLESLRYDGSEWHVFSSNGLLKTSAAALSPIDGLSISTVKAGTTADNVVTWHSWLLATGHPGAWAPGTPGVAGRATDGTAAGDAGCLPLTTPASGSNYLVGWTAHAAIAHPIWLMDVLWVNSGLTVTTTTAQTVNSVAWPARDLRGSTSGYGVQIGILVVTATTNGGNIANTTMSYTNQAGTAGRTATLAFFPATANAGTIAWFELQAGDTGVQSIQSVTLGTSYGGGAISLIAARMLACAPTTTASIGASAPIRPTDLGGAGIKLYAGACLLTAYKPTSTTATVMDGIAYFEVR